jgi:hypothetical protein
MDASVFPHRLILSAMYEMTSGDFAQLPGNFFDSNEVWKNLFGQASEKNEFLRKTQLTSDPMIEIGSLQEYMDSIADQPEVDLATFLKILTLLGVTQEAGVADALLRAIRLIDVTETPGNTISTTICQQFVDVWRLSLQKKKQQIAHQLQINPEEEILKVLPLARIIERGDGILILTSKNLLFAPNHAKMATILAPLSKVIDIKKYQHKKMMPPGYPALTITASVPVPISVSTSSIKSAKKPDKPVDGTQSYSVLFFSDRDDWYYYLKEMQNAHKAAEKAHDPTLIARATTNITLVEALSKVGCN